MKRSFYSLLAALLVCFSLWGCAAEPITNTPGTTGKIPATSTIVESSVETTAEITVETTVAPTIEPTVEPTVETTVETTAAPTVETTAETVHAHTFAAATCTAPKTCSSCGETEGEPAGHNWEDATCQAPKTCLVCSKTSGSAVNHEYEDDACKWCGKAAPTETDEDMVWIPTKGGKKYHKKATCSNMIDPEEVTKEEAEELGFTPCKKCYK